MKFHILNIGFTKIVPNEQIQFQKSNPSCGDMKKKYHYQLNFYTCEFFAEVLNEFFVRIKNCINHILYKKTNGDIISHILHNYASERLGG